MLTTQLQNQDPLDPADTTEFTNQLVSFAGVEQQINANQRLESLVSLGLGTSFSSSLNYVGNDVSYLSAEAFYDGARPVGIDYSIDGASADTTINILDEDGTLILSQELNEAENVGSFVWDGRDTNGFAQPAGTYQIRVDALDSSNNPLTATTVVTGRVNGVETQNGTTFLLVGERAVSVGNVINVTESINDDLSSEQDEDEGEDNLAGEAA